MSGASTRRIAIVGAGLTGGLAALRFADRGHDVTMYDRRPDPRVRDIDSGRSINLALSTRGLDALARVDLADEIVARSVPLRGRMMHAVDGTLTYQPYSSNPNHVLHSVNRDDLNNLLLDTVDTRPNITTVFDCHIDDIDPDRPGLVLPSGEVTETDLVIGADGAYSAVRSKLQRSGRFNYEQDYLQHGYKELTIPADATGGYRIEPNALHIWPRGEHMMIALANPDGSFTCTLFWPFEGAIGFETIDEPAEIRAAFETHFPDAIELMPDLATDYLDHRVGSLVTVRCSPWHREDRVLLLGDAAHAVVPFYGQGANAALEDVTVLFDELDAAQDWRTGIERFATARKVDTDALADLAVDNFVEMRDHVASRWFLLRQRLLTWLHRRFPDRIAPLYEMVTFSRLGYREAADRAARQDRRLGATVVGLAVLLLVAALVMVVIALS